MSAISIEVESAVLRAALLFAGGAGAPSRTQWVHLDLGLDGGRVVTCCGKTMFIARIECSVPERTKLNLPISLVKDICGQKGLTVKVSAGADTGMGRTIVLDCGGMSISGYVDNSFEFFPYLTAVPETTSGEPAQYHPEFLARALKALDILIPRKGKAKKELTPFCGVRTNGDKPGVMEVTPDVLVVIAPYNTGLDAGKLSTPEYACKAPLDGKSMRLCDHVEMARKGIALKAA